MDQTTAGELLRDFERGDPAAFATLVARFEGPLLRYARCLCGDAAEDAVQEAFLRLAQRPPRLRDVLAADADREARASSSLSSWLYQVTRNCAMEMLRSDHRRRRREAATAASEISKEGIGRAELDDSRSAVERALTRLPDDQREALVLRLLAERSYKQIAEITGKPIGTIGWLISSGLGKLAKDLATPVLGVRALQGERGVR